jgi:uncharacterized protein YqgC (DUF456 family)
MEIAAAITLVLTLAAGWLAQLVGLPGTWLIVVVASLYAWWLPDDGRMALGWNTVLMLALLAVVGEVVETAAAAAGVKKLGGSRRGAVLAIAGSIVGSLVGAFVGLPIPIVGSLAAAVVFGGVGALVGAVIGETSAGRDFDASVTIGKAAFVGRLLGTLAKVIVCTVMVVVTLAALAL